MGGWGPGEVQKSLQEDQASSDSPDARISLFHFTYFEVLVLKSSVWLLEESSRAFEQHFLEAFLMTFPPGSFHNRENHAV